MMKQLLAPLCAALIAMSCGDSGPANPSDGAQSRVLFETGKIDVLVQWEGDGIPNKRVEIVELGIERLTDASGHARFMVSAGDYTVRVYEINRGGPPIWIVDTKVTVTVGETVPVEVIDCLPCV